MADLVSSSFKLASSSFNLLISTFNDFTKSIVLTYVAFRNTGLVVAGDDIVVETGTATGTGCIVLIEEGIGIAVIIMILWSTFGTQHNPQLSLSS